MQDCNVYGVRNLLKHKFSFVEVLTPPPVWSNDAPSKLEHGNADQYSLLGWCAFGTERHHGCLRSKAIMLAIAALRNARFREMNILLN
jgi:hypothetical protein